MNIKYSIDNKLVRGLDYYSRTVFEIQCEQLGAQDALCGGGRYDNLIENLGGKSTPAIGFAAGIERLILALDIKKYIIENSPDVYIVSVGENAIQFSIKIANMLRVNKNFIVITDTLRRGLKSQMKEANKLNSKYAIIIGDNEIKNNKATIKNMSDGNQETVIFDNIESYFNTIK